MEGGGAERGEDARRGGRSRPTPAFCGCCSEERGGGSGRGGGRRRGRASSRRRDLPRHQAPRRLAEGHGWAARVCAGRRSAARACVIGLEGRKPSCLPSVGVPRGVSRGSLPLVSRRGVCVSRGVGRARVCCGRVRREAISTASALVERRRRRRPPLWPTPTSAHPVLVSRVVGYSFSLQEVGQSRGNLVWSDHHRQHHHQEELGRWRRISRWEEGWTKKGCGERGGRAKGGASTQKKRGLATKTLNAAPAAAAAAAASAAACRPETWPPGRRSGRPRRRRCRPRRPHCPQAPSTRPAAAPGCACPPAGR